MSMMFPAQGTPEPAAEQRVAMLAARLTRTLGIACALAENGRRIDLRGIEDGVGMLCAQALDAFSPDAQSLVPALREVLSRVNRLTELLQSSRAG